MESLYYVMCWACHRSCRHCYEARFRPYVHAELEAVVREAEANFPRIIAHLPERHRWLDRTAGPPCERPGRIILSGGEALLAPVFARVTLPVIDALGAKWRGEDVRIVVQTTGDLLTASIIRTLLDHGVWMISVAGVDDYHVGMQGKARQAAFVARLTALFRAEGMRAAASLIGRGDWHDDPGPLYGFFGATPDSWIGKIWPRGRAWTNGLSQAGLADNFCARWSGGKGFLDHLEAGSEVSIEPDGNVYPCCIKTRLPIGNLCEESLEAMLDRIADDPVYRAINAGEPQRMGLTLGWSEERFLAASHARTPQGRDYANLCIGCDRFHDEVLAPRRAAARAGA